jgi:hypothetical protein
MLGMAGILMGLVALFYLAAGVARACGIEEVRRERFRTQTLSTALLVIYLGFITVSQARVALMHARMHAHARPVSPSARPV